MVGLATVGSLGRSSPPEGVGRKPGEIIAPSDMIAIGNDTTSSNKFGGWGTFFPDVFGVTDPAEPTGQVHDQGGNMVLVDCHAEWARWWKWIEPSDQAASRWNYVSVVYRCPNCRALNLDC
jgi:hypothetical protein